MLFSEITIWMCSLFFSSCGLESIPNISIIQAAYEQEASEANSWHDKGLKVLQASCDDRTKDPFLCKVTFLSTEDPKQRLYFDIVAVSRTREGWKLKSGLCKR